MSITERIDNITKMPAEYACIRPPAPKSVKIELTGKCNYKCSFCASSKNMTSRKEMDFERYKRYVSEMRLAGVEELGVFFIGESFLCSWLEEAIAYAKNVCKYPYVFLTTNGSLCYPDRLKACFEAGLDSLKFSFNYADNEQFEGIAKVNSVFFDNMLDNVKSAKPIRDQVEAATGKRCNLYAGYIQYNDEQDEKIAALLDEMGDCFDEVYGLPLYNKSLFVDSKEGWTGAGGNQGRLGALRPPLPCWALFTEGHISHDGKVSACCFEHDGRFYMGDLKEDSFMDCWHSDKFQALRAAHLKKDVGDTACGQCISCKKG